MNGDMKTLKKDSELSRRAKSTVKKLIRSKKSSKAGYIGAVDPKTGEVFYGMTIAGASKEGRKKKNDPKATFFFVRVGSPSVHVLKALI